MSDKIFGATFTVFGVAQIIVFVIIASVLSGIAPQLTAVWYGMAALLSVEALMVIGFGITMLTEDR